MYFALSVCGYDYIISFLMAIMLSSTLKFLSDSYAKCDGYVPNFMEVAKYDGYTPNFTEAA